MVGTEALISFLVALFFLEITPGPDMMFVIGRGISEGRKIALLTVFGSVFVAGIVQVALLVLGLGSLLQAYPAALTGLRWFGAAYLAWLGLRMIGPFMQGKRQIVVDSKISGWSAVRDGTINNLTNPKSFLFMFAFLPQFVNPSLGPVWVQLLIFGTLQKLTGMISLGFVALASGSVGKWLNRWPGMLAWQQRFTGLIMIGLAIRLLVTGNTGSSQAS